MDTLSHVVLLHGRCSNALPGWHPTLPKRRDLSDNCYWDLPRAGGFSDALSRVTTALIGVILLMEEIPNNQLGCMKTDE